MRQKSHNINIYDFLAGLLDREVKQTLWKTLLKCALHQDKELFGKAYEYIRQYY
jgi:hypothetical protein